MGTSGWHADGMEAALCWVPVEDLGDCWGFTVEGSLCVELSLCV